MIEIIENIIATLVVLCILVLSGMFLICLIAAPYYYSPYRQAEVYNKIHGTHYSTSDFFWANDQINSSTQTININTTEGKK